MHNLFDLLLLPLIYHHTYYQQRYFRRVISNTMYLGALWQGYCRGHCVGSQETCLCASLNYLPYLCFFLFGNLSIPSILLGTEIPKQTGFNNNTFEKENLLVHINENSCSFVGFRCRLIQQLTTASGSGAILCHDHCQYTGLLRRLSRCRISGTAAAIPPCMSSHPWSQAESVRLPSRLAKALIFTLLGLS